MMRSDDFFFFKQKTAYEMRISDWSSDVCSSDLDDLQGLAHVVVRDQHADAAVLQVGNQVADVAYGDRVVARQRLVEQDETGRASCRERGCQYVWNLRFAAYLKTTQIQ